MLIQNPTKQNGAKNFSVSCRTEKLDVEQARLSTICSARAEFADFVLRPGFVRIPAATRNASLFSCQRTLRPLLLDRPAPGGTFTPFTKRQSNKKPGVERRAKPSVSTRTGSRDARLICYPEFVIDLACEKSIETLNAPDKPQLFVRRIESISDSSGSSSGPFHKCENLVNIPWLADSARK